MRLRHISLFLAVIALLTAVVAMFFAVTGQQPYAEGKTGCTTDGGAVVAETKD